MTSDYIIQLVCIALKLDRDKLLYNEKYSEKIYVNNTRPYVDGRFIATTLIRENIKVKKSSKKYGEEQLRITYKELSKIFNRSNHATAINAEIQCKNLVKTDRSFKRKFDMVVNLLECNLNFG